MAQEHEIQHKTPITLLLFVITSVLLVYVVVSNILSYLSGTFLEQYGENGVVQFICYSLSFILTILYCAIIHRYYRPIRIPTLRGSSREINSPLIVGGVVTTLALSVVISPLLDSMPQEHIDTISSYIHGGFWPMLTAIVAAPLLEEILFRGVIQKSLVARFGPIIGIIGAASIFGALHIIPQQMIYSFGVGLILGTIYYLTGSLVGAITVHFVNNGLTTLLYLTFGTSTGIERQLLGDGALWDMVYFCSCLILLGAAATALNAIHNRVKRIKNTTAKI